MSQLDPQLLQMLACPLGKKPLQLEEDWLVCSGCGAWYPIRDGIPVLLINEARLPQGVSKIEELSCHAGQ